MYHNPDYTNQFRWLISNRCFSLYIVDIAVNEIRLYVHAQLVCTRLVSHIPAWAAIHWSQLKQRGINQDFRYEIRFAHTCTRVGSEVTEQQLCVHIWGFEHMREVISIPATTSPPPLDRFFIGTRRWRKPQHYFIHLPLDWWYELIWRGRSLQLCVPVVQRKSSRINRKQ